MESQDEGYACEKCSPYRHKKSSAENQEPNTCWWRRTAAKVAQAAHSRRREQPDDQAKISPNGKKAVIYRVEALR